MVIMYVGKSCLKWKDKPILPNQVTFCQGSSYIQSEDIDNNYSYIHNLSNCEIKAWKYSDLNGIQTLGYRKVPYQLISYQASWKLVTCKFIIHVYP